ncbi:hypothetical protein Leryth_016531 [Lithospermum erythrorhizon]|nr:hypothetical protein Leryth_016531 [Lithospermum erythrorhizon]
MMMMRDGWNQLGSTVAAIVFFWTMHQNYFPDELHNQIKKITKKLTSYFYPYIKITFPESDGENWLDSRRAFHAIERYLGFHSSTQAKCLKAKVLNESEAVILSMDDREEVTDEFNGVKLWWKSNCQIRNSQSISLYPGEDVKRSFVLTFHQKHRDIVTESYLKHVLEEGKDIALRQRKRKLFSNTRRDDGCYELWSHVVFEHPASFETLAMEGKKKKEIIDDLVTFSKSKEYYAKIGKAWKRGYLLYGPPGTGKSTMIAAMANFLNYDVYDLELTAVKDNSELRRLLINTSSKSIVVIEDIDCSLDLAGRRGKKAEEDSEDEEEEGNKANVKEILKEMKNKDEKSNKLTLSGLLNCIDGLWSTCGEERLFVFTTNYVEKLDPALISRGRMDKHIELAYCCFESFEVLARNYWNLESHELFPTIQELLGKTKMTPADVAENLMPKSADDDASVCLERLIKAIETEKEEARLKAEEEKRTKAENEEKLEDDKENKQ